jgi:hypothetical protein
LDEENPTYAGLAQEENGFGCAQLPRCTPAEKSVINMI